MESVSLRTQSVENTVQNTVVPPVEPVKESSGSGEFETFLRANLAPDASNQVSEEELFAALIPERINKLKGEEISTKFSEAFTSAKGSMARGDGFVPVEDAAKSALETLVADGTLTKEEGDKIYAESFSAAQLDSNTSALFDSRGGPGDATIAMEDLEKALLGARLTIEAFDSGEQVADVRSLSEPTLTKAQLLGGATDGILTSTASVVGGIESPQGTLFDGEGNFLFKPEAGDGRLAILSPDGIGPLVESMKLMDKEGKVIEEGRFTSFGDDGRNRAKYSFNQAGGNYPKDIVVEMKMIDGTIKQYQIPDPGQRYD